MLKSIFTLFYQISGMASWSISEPALCGFFDSDFRQIYEMSQQFQVRRQMCHIRSRFPEACAAVVRCVRLRSKSRQLHRILVLQRSAHLTARRTATKRAGNSAAGSKLLRRFLARDS
ncbi:Hypothetical_protein [Hexamita inflata]|uniref:Hypothetical_protein n=1 Tax=Hexamita inflata TaxID=28002 RepID=A0AA86ND02_9EUKA|nr:Hypothetical protein HINF_LOCUS4429 [Hexamita inflata]